MKEFHGNVTYYGIGKIFKEYAGFPRWLPLPVSVQHGWTTITSKHDARYNAVENWYWSKTLEKKYQANFPGLKTRTIGAPFLYLLKMLNYTEPNEKQGSIVFPSHSSKLIAMKCDFNTYADLLDELPEEYKPITICMYYLDQEKGLDQPFKNKGFEIVNNGNSLYDVSFLKNFIQNTHGKKYAFSNQMTSALLFASAMGLQSHFYGPEFEVESSDPNYIHLDYNQHHRQWESEYAKLFHFPNCDLQAQQNFVSEELGESYVLSKQSMKILLYRHIFARSYLSKLFSRFKSSLGTKFPVLRQINSLVKKYLA